MALCDTCSNLDLYQIFDSHEAKVPTASDSEPKLFWHEQLDGWYFKHSEGILPIQVAAAAGCGLCSLLCDAFNGKDALAAQEVSDLPIILAPGATIEDEWNDPPRFSPYLEPKLRSFFLSPQDGLLKLCELDISIDKSMSQLAKAILSLLTGQQQRCSPNLQSFHSNPLTRYTIIQKMLAVWPLLRSGFQLAWRITTAQVPT